MITAEQIHQASELLYEREELSHKLTMMQKAKVYSIIYGEMTKVGLNENNYETFDELGKTRVAPISTQIRKTFQTEIEQQIAAIDARLTGLGVQPPEDGDD